MHYKLIAISWNNKMIRKSYKMGVGKVDCQTENEDEPIQKNSHQSSKYSILALECRKSHQFFTIFLVGGGGGHVPHLPIIFGLWPTTMLPLCFHSTNFPQQQGPFSNLTRRHRPSLKLTGDMGTLATYDRPFSLLVTWDMAISYILTCDIPS